MSITLRPGSLVVFEGLDATGKTTQLERIRDAARLPEVPLFGDNPPLFIHQPSGGNAVGEMVYKLTEQKGTIETGLARQYLHLASHAEQWALDILPTLEAGGSVFMDRCWWSTIAYGWFSAGLVDTLPIHYHEFRKMVMLPTQQRMPDLVFLFTRPHAHDDHNTWDLERGYQHLLKTEHDYPVVEVPKDNIEATTQFIFTMLHAYHLAADAA